jgi:hypothetical protein
MHQKIFFRNFLILISFFASLSLANPTTYFYSGALLKVRSVDGINIKVTNDLTLFLSRADWYRHFPPLVERYKLEWWGYDYNVGLNYKLMTWGPLTAIVGINEMILLRAPLYRERRERANLNLNANVGPLSLGFNTTVERRDYQTDTRFKKFRARFLVKAATSKSFSKLQITPFASWEYFIQKRDSIDLGNGDSYPYREAEAGFTSKLGEKISIGISDAFEYFPNQTNKNKNARTAHRVSTTFFYSVDLSKKK